MVTSKVGYYKKLLKIMAKEVKNITAAERVLTIYTKNFNVLDKREQEIIEKYYGFGSYSRHTLEEIAVELKMTRERVRQIKYDSIQKLNKVNKTK